MDITDIKARLTDVENKTTAITQLQQVVNTARGFAEVMQKENEALKARLDDAEDRSRRDNLVFFGIADTLTETWSQTEESILNIFQQSLNLQVANEAIIRTHRIGAFCQTKCCPVIVKFSSYKIKDQILQQRLTLKADHISVSEDYSIETRQARKKLIEFAKEKGDTFKLRHNKMPINNIYYAYDTVNDNVYEVGPSVSPIPSTTQNLAPSGESPRPSISS